MSEMQVWQREIQATATANRELFAVTADTARIDELSNKVMQLTQELEAANGSIVRQRNRIDEINSRHRADIDLISEALLEEADSRGWCSEFDEFVETINAKLNFELTPRAKEYEFTFTLSFTVKAEASSEDAAEEFAWDYARRMERFADNDDNTDGNSALSLD